MLFSFSVVLAAVLLDYKFAELSRHHPLVYFGHFITQLEKKLNQQQQPSRVIKILGILAWCLAVIPLVYLSYLFERFLHANYFFSHYDEWLFSAFVLYVAIGWQSLSSHANAIITPLKNGDIAQARKALSYIVSRDTEHLTSTQISNATTESVLENGADAIFSAIFWFLIAGVPGVVLYRCVNTLDAMWGYKNERFLYFGWMAARSDDVMNYIPARLTALSYAILGNTRVAKACWQAQGFQWKSPNAGPVMSAGAGALNVRLGGGSIYHGQWQERPILGNEQDKEASCFSIESACLLVDRVLALWLISLCLIAIVVRYI